MTIFAILMPTAQPGLAERITEVFPQDHLRLTDTQWLVSSSATVIDVVGRLGIHDVSRPDVPPTGVAVVFAVSSYYGRAPTAVWDWIKVKMETRPGG